MQTIKASTRKETRGDLTKERIVQEAVQIFSLKGFYNTSLDDILRATGLSKGGFFCHFKTKEELGFATLDRAVRMWMEKVLPIVDSKSGPLEKLLALIDGHCFLAESETFRGGCLFLTLGTEMDDQHELFREKIKHIIADWRQFITDIIEDGRRKGIFRKTIKTVELANLIIAAIEGTVFLAKVNRDPDLFFNSMKNLKKLIIDFTAV